MKKILSNSSLAPLVTVCLLAMMHPAPVQACTVCMGDKEADATKGVGYAILFMVGVIYVVLGGIIGAFFVVGKKVRQASTESDTSLS